MSVVDEMDPRLRHAQAKAPRGRLGRYALFQLKDFAVERGIAMVLIAVMVAIPQLMFFAGARTEPPPVFQEHNIRSGIVSTMMWMVFLVGGILTVPIMVSRDRTEGFHRFLFAKPVSITAYYARQFLAQLAGFVGVSALVMLGLNLFAFSFPVGGVLAAAIAFFVGVGGIGFLFSTLVRADWIWLLGSMVLSMVLNAVLRDTVWAALLLILPPVQELGAVGALMVGQPYPLGDIVWVIMYGLTAFTAGLFVLRKRSITA